MAVYDELRREVVVRLVYDGPPSAGKTSTLYSLLERLPAKVLRQFLSSDPVGARTQVFDWLELPRAALKDGPQRLRCQLIAVPGQSEYAPRRKALLALADAVVFVSGSSEPDFPISRAALRELTSLVTEQQRRLAPVGFVLQANKQDLEGALPPAEVARRLGLNARLPVVGSTAKLGDGVHRAFITALRFAAQRARSLMASGKIERTARGVQEAQDLYDQLVEAEAYDSRQEEYEHSAGGFEDLVRTYQKTPPEPVAAASISAPPTVAPSARVSDLEQGGDLDSAPEARGSDAAVANSVESTALDAVEEPEVGRRAEPSEARAAAAPATVSDSAISSAAPVEPTPDPAPVVEPAPVAAAAPVVDSASPAEPAAIAPPEASEPPAIESEPEVAEPVADAPVESEPSVVAAPAASESPAPTSEPATEPAPIASSVADDEIAETLVVEAPEVSPPVIAASVADAPALNSKVESKPASVAAALPEASAAAVASPSLTPSPFAADWRSARPVESSAAEMERDAIAMHASLADADVGSDAGDDGAPSVFSVHDDEEPEYRPAVVRSWSGSQSGSSSWEGRIPEASPAALAKLAETQSVAAGNVEAVVAKIAEQVGSGSVAGLKKLVDSVAPHSVRETPPEPAAPAVVPAAAPVAPVMMESPAPLEPPAAPIAAAPVVEEPSSAPTPATVGSAAKRWDDLLQELPQKAPEAGNVWPPIAARATLTTLLAIESLKSGELWRELGDDAVEYRGKPGWRLFTRPVAWNFPARDAGRRELMPLVRRCVAMEKSLPNGKTVVLAATAGGFRLWEMTPDVLSLADRLQALPADRRGTELRRASAAADAAVADLIALAARAGAELTVALDTLALTDVGPLYLGPLAPAGERAVSEREAAAALQSQLAALAAV